MNNYWVRNAAVLAFLLLAVWARRQGQAVAARLRRALRRSFRRARVWRAQRF